MRCNENDVESQGGDDSSNIEKWLPISASRKAKWWYSAFHNVTAMVGAGVLGSPFALSQLGWYPGITVIIVSWLMTFYSLWQLVQMHELVPGRRFDRYFDLGEHVFGSKGRFGYWMIMIQQLIVQVASTIVYSVTGGKSLMKLCEILDPSMFGEIRQTYYIVLFVCLQLFLSQIPNLNNLKGISLPAFMSVCYSMVAFGTSVAKGLEHHPTFAFAGHSVVLEIQATLPSTEEKPSKIAMWRGVVAVVIVCYLTVAVSGFWAFGDMVQDDILLSLERPAWVIVVANLMVFIHVIGSYQIYAMPVFHTMESCLVQNFNFKPSTTLRIVARSIYVAIVGLVAVIFPFFGGLLGFFGGLAFTSTSYIAKNPKLGSFHWIASMACIAVGCVIAIIAPIGGIRTIIVSMKTYKFLS
ncbi:hypothetical protein KIW84_010031 [Lathyrus oleraceus]|uniref:Amino acid transporter transmembrane domain-containing protein n=1 Tax=Pisum sativum TaxID=3888 RepID=A0A9D4YMD0_PEA|nr:hypothetical protein KIW84_010031 [Pisum sativum]